MFSAAQSNETCPPLSRPQKQSVEEPVYYRCHCLEVSCADCNHPAAHTHTHTHIHTHTQTQNEGGWKREGADKKQSRLGDGTGECSIVAPSWSVSLRHTHTHTHAHTHAHVHTHAHTHTHSIYEKTTQYAIVDEIVQLQTSNCTCKTHGSICYHKPTIKIMAIQLNLAFLILR